ncbi:TetR/AcrR family transcriptional regulator [Nocardia farcinica]|uniref:TetR/AcrR family transcriptional regulator n=1 Tax=Nocardia farcinica TaxID=37329 RepID=UPI000A3BAF24|nr:TetR family transcriptional regulator [Nocardia farcinica]MBA4855922.1 TetR/AcrR family transcriptional regulator [Nocardia farcinica]MBC9818543.1 TetR/AcrR family transcriptional regulator [Nocardia farcinica]MBF6284308.1 TetR/AcrR family transcriptional regulator [Nocardia farcinica]MBF6308816.1 TetR/AcrR family transcriptional regulator [Nocardia farcinica]MBF6363602.1 TetR/AcrR family transcriptional regulator [Nocardia farcinica]
MARIPAAERRADLVAAAVRMIAAHGVDGATTRRIAQEANAPLATLHYCFATKEVLFAAVFEYVAGLYRDVLTRSDVHDDVEPTARALMRGVTEWYVENPDLGAAIVELISWARRQEDKQAEIVYTEAFATMREILGNAAARAGRRIGPDTIDALSYILSALSDGFALNWIVFADRAAARRQIELTVAALDTWMAANLDGGPDAQAPEPEPTRRSLVSWVSLD